MNKFCINLVVPLKTVKALHMGRMTKPVPGENHRAYDMFVEIKDILEKANISSYSPYTLLIPEGTVDEQLAGKTEVVRLKHRIFTFNFKPTFLDKKEQSKSVSSLTKHIEYFSWVQPYD